MWDYNVRRWKRIEGFEKYWISDHGEVWSEHSNRMLVNKKIKGGYCQVKLPPGKLHLVHRLVLSAFVGKCPKGLQSCHFDGMPGNNRISNLRWDTPKNNCADKKRHGTHNVMALLSERQVREVHDAYSVVPAKELARRYQVSLCVIYNIANFKTWRNLNLGKTKKARHRL